MNLDKYNIAYIQARGYLVSANMPPVRIEKAARLVYQYYIADLDLDNVDEDIIDDTMCALMCVELATANTFATRTGGEVKKQAQGTTPTNKDTRTYKAVAATNFRKLIAAVGGSPGAHYSDYLHIFASSQLAL